MKELILGCGYYKKRRVAFNTNEFDNPTFIDINPDCEPDLIWDLEKRPLPFEDNEFDEIHAYDVLEHIGRQGDWRGFFDEFYEYWRLLKPDGLMYITCPEIMSRWVWADPGHTRYLSPETIGFLSKEHMNGAVGKTQQTDYMWYFKGDFKYIWGRYQGGTSTICIQAIK